MKLHLDPNSNTSLPILVFLVEHDVPVEVVAVSLAKDEHLRPEYATLNPNKLVLLLENGEFVISPQHDGDFVLTQCSTILNYREPPPAHEPPPARETRSPESKSSRLGKLAALAAAAVVGAGIASGLATLMRAPQLQDSAVADANDSQWAPAQGSEFARLFARLRNRRSVQQAEQTAEPVPRLTIEDRRGMVTQPGPVADFSRSSPSP